MEIPITKATAYFYKEIRKMTDEELKKLVDCYAKHELTPIEKMSDYMLMRKLDIARKNIEKWQKREKEIQRERSRRYSINNHFLEEIGR